APWQFSPHSAKSVAVTLSQNHTADCIGATIKLGPIIATALRKLRGQRRQWLLQAYVIDAALMTLNKNDMTITTQIMLPIDKIYTQYLGRRLLMKQLT
ncbi:hypothetical protein GGH92_011038, partial [Coemansia sp. RSA 2673]